MSFGWFLLLFFRDLKKCFFFLNYFNVFSLNLINPVEWQHITEPNPYVMRKPIFCITLYYISLPSQAETLMRAKCRTTCFWEQGLPTFICKYIFFVICKNTLYYSSILNLVTFGCPDPPPLAPWFSFCHMYFSVFFFRYGRILIHFFV